MNMGKFIKEWQVTDNYYSQSLSEFFFQFTFNLLWITQTQEIINHRISKIHEWVWGDVYEWGKVS